MDISTIVLVVTAGSLFFLIIGTLLGITSLFTRRLSRSMEQSEARLTASIEKTNARLDKTETRLTVSIEKVETRLTASIEKVETEQKVTNTQISGLAHKVYTLNGQLQRLVVHVLGKEGIIQEDVQIPLPTPSLSHPPSDKGRGR